MCIIMFDQINILSLSLSLTTGNGDEKLLEPSQSASVRHLRLHGRWGGGGVT